MSEPRLLEIDVDQEIEKIVRQLNSLPDRLKAPNVLAKAMNLTASEIRQKTGRKARKKYAISDNNILKDKKQGGMFLERASGGTATATLVSRGPMMEVMAYMTRGNIGGSAAMLKVLNESGMTALEIEGRKAFETTFKSGHTAIVQRRGKERLPIKKLLAPAVPFLYGKSYEEAEMDYYAILQKHIERQVFWITNHGRVPY